MTVKQVANGVERAQALGLPLRYASTRTSEAKVTMLPDGRYHLSVTVPLSEVKPGNVNERIRKAQQNGFEPSLTMTASKKKLETTEPVEVRVTGTELRVEATFSGSPAKLTGLLKELQGLDLSFTHARGMPEFRVDLQLSELTLDRTPVERELAEKNVADARVDLKSWRSEFEEAKGKVPAETAALEKQRTDAARAIDDAQAAVSRARSAIDERAKSVPTAQLAAALRAADSEAGAQWLAARVALDTAKAGLRDAEALEAERAELARAGVSPDEAGAAPDLTSARARVEQLSAELERADAAVRAAFKDDPSGRAHLNLAKVTGAEGDRARSELLSESITALSTATFAAHELAQERVVDPNTTYPQLIAAAEAEVARLEAALAQLAPAVTTIELGKAGDDEAQRALFGVGPTQSWDEWRKATLEAASRD